MSIFPGHDDSHYVFSVTPAGPAQEPVFVGVGETTVTFTTSAGADVHPISDVIRCEAAQGSRITTIGAGLLAIFAAMYVFGSGYAWIVVAFAVVVLVRVRLAREPSVTIATPTVAVSGQAASSVGDVRDALRHIRLRARIARH